MMIRLLHIQRKPQALQRALAALIAAFLLLAGLSMGAAAAYAESETSPVKDTELEGNEVNTRQLPDGSFIYETSIEDLAKADTILDKKKVVITGEVVGEKVNAFVGDDGCWLTISSVQGGKATNKVYSPSTISVYAPTALADVIDTYGGYGVTGTIVQVSGTFNLACVEHEGVSDVHADQITASKKGVEHRDTFSIVSFIPGIVLMIVAGLLLILFRRVVERQR